MRIPQEHRRAMEARVHEIEAEQTRLMAEIESLTAQVKARVPDPVTVQPEVAREVLPLVQRRLAAAERLVELTREAGPLVIDHMASENPFKTGGLPGRARKVKALRAYYQQMSTHAVGFHKSMAVDCFMFDVAAKGDEPDPSD